MEFRLRQERVPPNGPSSTTLPSSGRRHERAIARFPSRLLPVTDQHIAAGGTKLCAIFLEASQDSEIALIHQAYGRNAARRACKLSPPDRCRCERGRSLKPGRTAGKAPPRICTSCSSFRFQETSAIVGTSRRSFHHHRVVTPLRGWGTAQQEEFTNEPQTFHLIGATAVFTAAHALVGFTRARDWPRRAGSACARTACAGRHRIPASGTGRTG